VALPTSYQSLLRTAGFVDVVATDLTADFRSTLRRWTDATERREPLIRDAVGDDTYEDRAATRRHEMQGIDEGLLTRVQYTAVR
jgi:hypothetical protein